MRKNNEKTKIEIGKMVIVVTSKDALHIEMNGYTYFVDDSTNEQLIKKYKDKKWERKN